MGLFDAFGYEGKRALVVGGATGMGAAVAELVHDAGAEVVVMDRAEVTLAGRQGHPARPVRQGVDRRGRRRSAAGRSHALFSCAGVADGTPGHREDQLPRPPLPDRAAPRRRTCSPRGSAIGMISSAAGFGLGAEPREGSTSTSTSPTSTRPSQWAHDNGQADYIWSKQSPSTPTWPARRSTLLKQGHPHQRHPARAHRHAPRPGQRRARGSASAPTTARRSASRPSTPLEQAYPLVFLCSDAAAGITGITMVTDAGYFAAGHGRVVPAGRATPSASCAACSERTPGAPAPPADARQRVVLDVGRRRPPAHPGLRRLRRARPPAGADLPGVPQPVVGAGRGVRAGHGRRLHGQPAPVAARLRAALRDRQRRPRRGPDGPPHDQHRRVRARRGRTSARRSRSASSSTTTCGSRCSSRPARPTPSTGSPSPQRPTPRPPRQRRPLRAPVGAVGRRPLGHRPAADGRSAVARRRRLPRRGRRRRARPSTTSTGCRPTRARPAWG